MLTLKTKEDYVPKSKHNETLPLEKNGKTRFISTSPDYTV